MHKLFIIIILLLATTTFAAETGDLIMKAGADYRANLTWTQSGVPVNLTGRSYSAQFRSAAYPGGTLFATYSAVITSATLGKMDLRLSKAQTTALSGKTGVWDLRQVDSTGLVTYQFGGKVVVLPTVTR